MASMMFMMPMPLTSRVTIEISSSTQVRPVAMRSAMDKQRGEIGDVVNRLRAVPRLQDALDLRRRRNHHRRIFHGEIQKFDAGGLHEIAADGVRDQHRVVDDLRLAEGFHALLESSDDGEGQSGEFDDFAHGRLRRTVNLHRHFLGDHADLIVSLRILLIEESSRRDHQIAHPHVLGIDAENGDILLPAVADRDAVGELGHGRRSDDAGHDFLDGVEVVDGEGVRVGVADVRRAAEIFRPDFVGADGLDLIENKLTASHADGDDEDERCRADNHAQCGQDEAHLVAAKSVVGEGDDLAEGHLGPKALGHQGSSHLNLDAT